MTVSERMMMEHDDEAARRAAELARIRDEWLALHEDDWSWMRDYMEEWERLEMLDEIMAADSTYDAKRKWSKRAAEKYAMSELEANDYRERLAKCEREEA